MSFPPLLPSVSFVIRESGAATLDPDKSHDGSAGVQILQKIAPGLLQNGYRIIHLKRRSASIAVLRCFKGDLRVGMIISAVTGTGGVFHCELDIWRIHSILDSQAARRRRMQRGIHPLRELCCVVDRQVRAAFELDAIRWAAGTKDLPIIGSDGRPELPATSDERTTTRPVPVRAGTE